jgi:arsenate reductase (thioredoxin)
MTDVPQVLFVCVHNAGRSQMAAVLLDHEARGQVRVMSAGSRPASEINPAVIQAMAETGLDLAREFPKPLTSDQVQTADIIITMGCGDACPVYPGKRYLDWDLPDPAGLPLEEVRPIRDDIQRRVRQLIAELNLSAGA